MDEGRAHQLPIHGMGTGIHPSVRSKDVRVQELIAEFALWIVVPKQLFTSLRAKSGVWVKLTRR
jgi:hypothetical protein